MLVRELALSAFVVAIVPGAAVTYARVDVSGAVVADGEGESSSPLVRLHAGASASSQASSQVSTRGTRLAAAFATAVAGGERLGSCAVVGTGSSLSGSSAGPLIDAHDWVFRMNANHMKDLIIKDSGIKTDVIIAGHGWWEIGVCMPECWTPSHNRDAVLIGDFLPSQCHDECRRGTLAEQVMIDAQALNMSHDIYSFADSRAQDLGRRLIAAEGGQLFGVGPGCTMDPAKMPGLTPDGLADTSSGFMAFLMAALTCDRVSLYGFGPDDGKYSMTSHGGMFSCNHAWEAEHRLMKKWASGCSGVPTNYFEIGGQAEERWGPQTLKKMRSAWRPGHHAEDERLLSRMCKADVEFAAPAGAAAAGNMP